MSLDVNGLSFRYKETPVLKNVSFSVQPGELLCVLGPNGVGKSTLFRCMLGLLREYEGSISVNGAEIQSLSVREMAKKIAYIPQWHHPGFYYSVLDTVMMGTAAQLKVFGGPGEKERMAAENTLERLGILHLKDRGCDRISGGERQLALIARAIVQQAEVLVMDEPTANLDYGNQVRVMKVVGELAKQGYAVILSTHNPEHAFYYANRVLVLLDGAVLCHGAPSEVLSEEILRKVYGIQVYLKQIVCGGQEFSVCVPSLEEGR